MPYVTRYLVNELAAMNIKVTFDVEKISCLCVCLKDRQRMGGNPFMQRYFILFEKKHNNKLNKQ